MTTAILSSLAACVAGLAVVLCVLSVALELQTPLQIAMLVAGALLLAFSGGLIGVAIASQRKSDS